MNFESTLEKHHKLSKSNRDKGNRFESLILGFFKTVEPYSLMFKSVWLWNDFPCRESLGKVDTGIDIVAFSTPPHGGYWAIQCKFYSTSSQVTKKDLDSFLSTSSRKFEDSQGKWVGFSRRLIVSTTNKWSSNAEDTIRNQDPPVLRLNQSSLSKAEVDWAKLDQKIFGKDAKLPPKYLREYQQEALKSAVEHFKKFDRGKLTMACGTGKTFTSLKITERLVPKSGFVLYLVPSIALLGQTLHAWNSDTERNLSSICICSDPGVSKRRLKFDIDSYSSVDLGYPVSTDADELKNVFQRKSENGSDDLTVIFSTYQSIDVVASLQKDSLNNVPAFVFDLIICDEAHRTTGVTLVEGNESTFVKIHNNDFIKGKRRIYMTATPRLYDDRAKSRAKESDAILCSMDDEELYGKEFFRIGFSKAVKQNILSDYKVLVLTIKEDDPYAHLLANESNEINAPDAAKLIGCINALSKHIIGDGGAMKSSDPYPMKTAVAFCQTISNSKKIQSSFNLTNEAYMGRLPEDSKKKIVSISAEHIDGTMSAPKRDKQLEWLKTSDKDGECKIITNVRCLSEGVDVPSLDAVMFLASKNSQIDVVQSVGRVMRKSEGKKYGYIIIPVVIPSEIDPSQALADNKRYQVIWSVLNALRAHDDRFNATVNQINLNKKKPDNIIIGGIEYTPDRNDLSETRDNIGTQLEIEFEKLEKLQGIIYAKIVQKVGDRVYWENWAKEVGEIQLKEVARIENLIDKDPEKGKEFEKFVGALRGNIHPDITKIEAIELLGQHLITKPVFEALFEDYEFSDNNAVSRAMEQTIENLGGGIQFRNESKKLERFYDAVRGRIEGIDTAEGKQKIIKDLYGKFFATALPKVQSQLGIVYTPIEIVDFILHSVDDLLKTAFRGGLTCENVHILDPFTGTGTFITRLLQIGLIEKRDIERKYRQEIHANELVLLAYYIADVNIENAYYDVSGSGKYLPYDGIVLTDTFQLGEKEGNWDNQLFPDNSERVNLQRNTPIRVIIGNPPYSTGQKSANDDAQNQSYPVLEEKIKNTYVDRTTDTITKNSLYDSYFKAFRWASDRISAEKMGGGGIIAFVTNGAWLDTTAGQGFRRTIEKEFSSIYVFNLRGNARTSGEIRKKERDNVFGQGTRTPICITFLIKKPKATTKATIRYHDIGDYLTRDEKLEKIKRFKSILNEDMKLKTLKPDKHGDWINQRKTFPDDFIPLCGGKKFDPDNKSFFITYSLGAISGRDAFVNNFSKERLKESVKLTISHYRSELERVKDSNNRDPKIDNTKGVWTDDWRAKLKRGKDIRDFDKELIYTCSQRPFTTVNRYFADDLNSRRYQTHRFFLDNKTLNPIISLTAKGASTLFSTIITNKLTDRSLTSGQGFPLHYYLELDQVKSTPLERKLGKDTEKRKQYNITNHVLKKAQKLYGLNVNKEDIFYYVYGFLHSPEYIQAFGSTLKKELPKIPLLTNKNDFWDFTKAGKKLAHLHINYEDVPKNSKIQVNIARNIMQTKMNRDSIYKMVKMKHLKKDRLDTIIFNDSITITNIPKRAYDYVVNGKSAIGWVMERYQITTDKKSKIENNPNDWAEERGNPRYILDLLLSVINVSIQTLDIIERLPKLSFNE